MRSLLVLGAVILVTVTLIGGAVRGQTVTVTRVTNAIVATCSAVVGVSPNGATWKVFPESQQACAQPVIEAFNPNDPAHGQRELNAQVTVALDTERLTSAVVWTVLKQMYPMDTDAQLKTKYGVARTRILDAFQAQPWK